MTYATCFSGIGGWELGLNACGWELKWQCERDEFCRTLLNERFGVPVYDDIQTLCEQRPGHVDALIGSPPCQPFSVAGKKGGVSDERHLYPAFIRAVEFLKPRWVLMEQVPNVLSIDGGRAFGGYLAGLAALGYSIVWHCIPACAVGANHQRDRIWIVAYATSGGIRRGSAQRETGQPAQLHETVSDSTCERCGEAGRDSERSSERIAHSSEVLADSQSEGSWGLSERAEAEHSRLERSAKNVADAISKRNNGRRERIAGTEGDKRNTKAERRRASVSVEGCGIIANTSGAGCQELNTTDLAARSRLSAGLFTGDRNNWSVEPDVGRVANGIPFRVDRLKGLGNAVVPQIPFIIGQAINEIEKQGS